MISKIFSRKLHNIRHIIGVVLLLVSLAPFVVTVRTSIFLTLCFGAFCLGISFVSDYITYKLTGTSYLSRILENGNYKTNFFLIAIVAGLIMEGISTYLAGLWVYPYYSVSSYFIITIIFQGFGWYFLCIILSYEAMKDILDKLKRGKTKVENSFGYEKYLYTAMLIVGEIGLLIVVGNVLISTRFFTQFYLDVSHYKVPFLSFGNVSLSVLSFYFIFEFIEYKKNRTSLLKDILYGYWNPLLAIILASIILALYMEMQNLPLRLWVYTNWPYQQLKLFGIPYMAYIFWPLHYICFLSMYRAFVDRPSQEIWKGDSIK